MCKATMEDKRISLGEIPVEKPNTDRAYAVVRVLEFCQMNLVGKIKRKPTVKMGQGVTFGQATRGVRVKIDHKS